MKISSFIYENYLTILLTFFLVYCLLISTNVFENITNTPAPAPQTVFAVGNAFTGLECIDDSLPLYSQDTNTYTALSIDGVNPVYRSNLNIPSYVQCRDGITSLFTPWVSGTSYKVNDTVSYAGVNYVAQVAHKSTSMLSQMNMWQPAENINTYLAKDGIRQLPSGDPKNPNTRDIFDTLSSSGYTTMKCEYNALNNPNHFCNKINNSYSSWCNKLDPFTKASHTECQSLPAYGSKPTTLGNSVGLTNTLYSNAPTPSGSGPTPSQISSCQNKDCVRNLPKGVSSAQCKINCTKCGSTTC